MRKSMRWDEMRRSLDNNGGIEALKSKYVKAKSSFCNSNAISIPASYYYSTFAKLYLQEQGN